MKYKENTVTILSWLVMAFVVLLLCVYVIPALLMGGFYLLLQILNWPLITLIVLINIGAWIYAIHTYTKMMKSTPKNK